MRIVISGATGSIGSRLMERLSPSHDVVGLGRNPDKINEMAKHYTMKACNLESQEFGQLMADADAFIHCAAFAAPRGKASQFQKNVDIVNAMIPVLKNHDVFTVFVSSASVFDEMPRETMMTSPWVRPKALYSKSKFDAERAVLGSAYENWTGLRPRAVIGRGDKTVLPRLEGLIRRNRVIVPGKGDALLDYTCMDNFLDCVEAALRAGPQRMFLNVSNGEPKTFKQLITTYGKHIHNISATRHVPLLPLRILASVMPTDRINHYALNQVSKPMVLDISETQRLLDWEPKQRLEACLEELA